MCGRFGGSDREGFELAEVVPPAVELRGGGPVISERLRA